MMNIWSCEKCLRAWNRCICEKPERVSDSSPVAGSVSTLSDQKDDQIKALRERCDWLHHMMLTYLVEIQKTNKGLRRLNRRLEKKQNANNQDWRTER